MNIEEQRQLARDKAAIAREAARKKIVALKNPPPQYYQMPATTGDPERDSAADLGELEKGFRKRMKDEQNRFRDATDSEYWCCVCFQSRAQKEAFLSKIGVLIYGDKYLDGQVVAEKLGIEIPTADIKYNKSDKVDKAWLNFVD